MFLYPTISAADVVFVEDPNLPEYDMPAPTFEENLNKYIKISQYFDEHYPVEKINEDMTDDIKRFFPKINNQEAYNMQYYVRKGLGLYRYLKNIYEEYKQKMLVPEPPPVVVAEDEYADKSPEWEYIDEDSGTIIFSDIKKIVPYSQNPRDTKSIRAKFERDVMDNVHTFDGLVNLFSKIELRKLPFYDILYPSPFSGILGIGAWTTTEGVYMRILTENSGIKDLNTLKAVIDIKIRLDRYVVANDGAYQKPKISFENTEKLENWEFFLPVPNRIITSDTIDRTAYIYSTAIPVTLNFNKSDEPLNIKADIDFYICDKDDKCSLQHLSPEITLFSNRSDNSSVANYVYQKHFSLPKPTPKDLAIDYMRSYKTPQGDEYLEMSVTAKEKISELSVFINNQNKIGFEAPRVSIDGKKAVVRFLPQNQKEKLANKEFEILLHVNSDLYLQQTLGAKEYNLPPSQTPKINLKLMILAFIGGLLLNLMPCVFPVLALKIFSLTKFGATRPASVRHNFCYTVLGIFSSFVLLATLLALLKSLGHGIGWGMQFQNPYFVVTMIFAIMIFFLAVCGITELNTLSVGANFFNKARTGTTIHFLTGSLAVLMATPCTAPYLATAVGFALSGSIADIYIILISVAFGLAFPYIFFYIFPGLIYLMPTPGPWMQRLSNIMALMLLLTLIWLFSVLLAQTNTYFIIRLAIYLAIAAIFIWFNSINKDMEYDKNQLLNEYVKKKVKIIFLSLFTILFIISLFDAGSAHRKHQEQISEKSESSLNIEKIEHLVKDGKTVLVSIGAEWCLTCHYNNFTTLNLPSFQSVLKAYDVEMINIDWTNYSQEVITFMQKYHRNGLPFYVLFSPLAPDGFVLPEILQDKQLQGIINNFTTARPRFE